MLRKIRQILGNIRFFFRFLFTNRCSDYHYMLILMQAWIKQYKYNAKAYRIIDPIESDHLNRVLELLDNIIKDDYLDRTGAFDHIMCCEGWPILLSEKVKELIKQSEDFEKAEWNELCNLIKSDAKRWWY